LSYQSITPKIYANSAWGYVIEECSNVRRKPLTDGRPVDLWREELEEVGRGPAGVAAGGHVA